MAPELPAGGGRRPRRVRQPPRRRRPTGSRSGPPRRGVEHNSHLKSVTPVRIVANPACRRRNRNSALPACPGFAIELHSLRPGTRPNGLATALGPAKCLRERGRGASGRRPRECNPPLRTGWRPRWSCARSGPCTRHAISRLSCMPVPTKADLQTIAKSDQARTRGRTCFAAESTLAAPASQTPATYAVRKWTPCRSRLPRARS